MPPAGRFIANKKGIGEMLRAEFMQDEMKKRAQLVEALAKTIAPTDDGTSGWSKRRTSRSSRAPGQYNRSFVVTSGVTFAGGAPRAYGRVTNTAPYASAVEYGFGETIRYRVLGRALAAAGGDLRPEHTY